MASYLSKTDFLFPFFMITSCSAQRKEAQSDLNEHGPLFFYCPMASSIAPWDLWSFGVALWWCFQHLQPQNLHVGPETEYFRREPQTKQWWMHFLINNHQFVLSHQTRTDMLWLFYPSWAHLSHYLSSDFKNVKFIYVLWIAFDF